MRALVLDASVATKLYVREPDSELAVALFDDLRFLFIAPDVFLPEVVNALLRQTREGQLSTEALDQALFDLDATLPQLIPSKSLIEAAVMLARNIGHPIYDCLYIALAERWDTAFITADLEFERKCQARAPELRRRRIVLLGHDPL
jgi:predicted nucleic acid-binding protein